MKQNIGCRLAWILLIVATTLIITACNKQRFERGYAFEEPGVKIYDTDKEYIVEGKVTDYVDALYEDEVPVGMMRLIANDNNEYLVQLAPIWYLRMERLEVKNGDRVRITGCPVGVKEMLPSDAPKTEEDQKNLITLLSRKVEVLRRDTTVVITLREKNGDPKWYGKGRYLGKQKYIQQMLKDNKVVPMGLEK